MCILHFWRFSFVLISVDIPNMLQLVKSVLVLTFICILQNTCNKIFIPRSVPGLNQQRSDCWGNAVLIQVICTHGSWHWKGLGIIRLENICDACTIAQNLCNVTFIHLFGMCVWLDLCEYWDPTIWVCSSRS
jgi:hypothetical protein